VRPFWLETLSEQFRVRESLQVSKVTVNEKTSQNGCGMASVNAHIQSPKYLRYVLPLRGKNGGAGGCGLSPRAKRMTLQQVAAHVGVSTPTISKVLNGRPDVAPATRERILRVLREQEYVPRGASALPMAHKHVELVFDALNNPNNLAMMKGVIQAATEDGSHVAVSAVGENINARQWVNELKRTGRAGIIMVTSRLSAEQLKRLDEAALPLALIDPINPVDQPLPSVGVSNWHGGRTAVQHLLDLGHRRIAMLRGYECLVDDARFHGYAAALSGAGIDVDRDLVARANFRFEPAVVAADRILRLPHPPTAVFAANDLEALGVIEAARRNGRSVPEDISVVGFDDSLYASVSSPGLTTLRQPLVQMGEVAYRILSDLIQGRDMASTRVELAATLIVRGSTAAPRPA
jgi:LacI family transcriptional regulator